MQKLCGRILIAINIFMLIVPGQLLAQAADGARDYRLGPDDVLQLNVIQQPTLDRTLLIRPDGTAIIPPVGEIALAELTVAEAEDLVRQKLRLFHRDVVDVSLTVIEYRALRIYVLGAVANPGSYTFDRPPTLWDAIREAGGASNDAVMSRVRVVARSAAGFSSTNHDLNAIVAGTGDVPITFLRSGQTVLVPSAGEESLAASSPENGVQVFGGVAAPGTYALTEPTELMTVLMLAGGPVAESKLAEVRWVQRDQSGRYSAGMVDMETFLLAGDPNGNPLVKPGDTIQVPRHRPGFFRTVYPILLGTITTAASIVLVVDRLND